MSAMIAMTIIFGLPLILVAIGFVIIAIKIFNGGSGRLERGQTLEAARKLELSLTTMENRLNALEDIFLADSRKKGGEDE